MIPIAAIVVIAVVAVGAFVIINNDSGKVNEYSFDDAELKVLGNINGDNTIDQKDYDQISKLIDQKATVDKYPLADANNDKAIDTKDLEIVKNIIDKKQTTVWHINYHDYDGNGSMDEVLVSSKWPISSVIVTGSSNTFIMLYMLDIIDEVKGASYGSTNDAYLFSDNYLNTSKVAKLGTSSTTIAFEDGKSGAASNVIKEKDVTCLITDWNRTYITNENNFEGAGVDVVRIAAASFDVPVYTHSILLLGFLFQKEDRANELVSLYDDTKDIITKEVSKISDSKKVKATASSMQGTLSSGDSDYTAVVLYAGALFGLEGYNFGGASSIYVADNLGVYDTTKYSWDYIVHIRTALSYAQDVEKIEKEWVEYTASYAKWEHAEDGQIFISGVVPVPVRVAYAAYAMYGDTVKTFSKEWADTLHQSFIDLYNGDAKTVKANEKTFVITKNPTTEIVYLAEDYSTLYDGKEHSITVTPVSSGSTVTYSTDGIEYSSVNPTFGDYGEHIVYFTITCDGRETVDDYRTVSINKKIEFTIEGYEGTVDGAKHGVTVNITEPSDLSDVTIKYYSSKTYVKTYGKAWADYAYSDAGEYTVWVYISAPGYQEEYASAVVKLTN